MKIAHKIAEIPPLKQRRELREHVVDVLNMDQEAQKYERIQARVAEEWESAKKAEKELKFGLKKRNAKKAPLFQRTREMREEADSVQHARLLEEIEQKRRAHKDKELSEQQRLQEERERFGEAQRTYKRKMNAKYWHKQYIDAKQYAVQHSLANAEQRNHEFDQKVELMKAEIHEMNNSEFVDSNLDLNRRPSSASVGIFGTSFAPGEWASSIDGGDMEGKGWLPLKFSSF